VFLQFKELYDFNKYYGMNNTIKRVDKRVKNSLIVLLICLFKNI